MANPPKNGWTARRTDRWCCRFDEAFGHTCPSGADMVIDRT